MPPLPFQVMLKPRGAVCNLDCAYCFYLAKEQLYPGAALRMPDEVLESYTRQYIQAMAQRMPPGSEIVFAWQGGEPLLMGLDFFRRAVELQRKYAPPRPAQTGPPRPREAPPQGAAHTSRVLTSRVLRDRETGPPGMRIQNALQTNATLLDEAWAKFFHQHGFLLGVSLDGPQALHDAYRVDKGGRGTFERVLAGIRLLQRARAEFNILACVNDRTARRPLEVYRFLRDEVGAQFIQFIPIVEKTGDGVSTRSVSGPAWGSFLNTIFDEWARRDVGRVFVQMFDTALGSWARAAGLPEGAAGGLCVHQPVCGQALALEHNGDLYACDHFVDPAYRLGNILETPLAELADSPAQLRFGQDKLDALPAICLDCRVRFACHGGCPKDRFRTLAPGAHLPRTQVPGSAGVANFEFRNSPSETRKSPSEIGNSKFEIGNYLCSGYYAFFTHIDRAMQTMTALLRAGRAPAEIMGMLTFEEAARKAGPRGACPCSSGKKVQDCHPTALEDPILRPPVRKRH